MIGQQRAPERNWFTVNGSPATFTGLSGCARRGMGCAGCGETCGARQKAGMGDATTDLLTSFQNWLSENWEHALVGIGGLLTAYKLFTAAKRVTTGFKSARRARAARKVKSAQDRLRAIA